LRPWSRPESPSTWSAWKWVRIASGTSVIPSRWAHVSSLAGSGPVSTAMAVCGERFRKSASPWPMSHTASDQGRCGVDGVVSWRSSGMDARPTRSMQMTPMTIRRRLRAVRRSGCGVVIRGSVDRGSGVASG
jgi:hypothetical protein